MEPSTSRDLINFFKQGAAELGSVFVGSEHAQPSWAWRTGVGQEPPGREHEMTEQQAVDLATEQQAEADFEMEV